MILVHAGNRVDDGELAAPRFPPGRIAAVTERIGALLDALVPRAVVSAPAAGADLIVLGEAQRRAIPVRVLLPLPVDRFVECSVADRGEMWVERFRSVMSRAEREESSFVIRLDLSDDPTWQWSANGSLISDAVNVALGEPVVALTVRPVGGEHPPSVTDDFAARARHAGLLVVTIDPRPLSDDVVAG